MEAGSRQTEFTALVLARYDEIVVTFIADQDEFTMILDVSGSPDDDIFNGTFRVDSDDREIDLLSTQFPRTFDFDYEFIDADKVVMTSEDDEPILETLFGIELDVEDVFFVFERTFSLPLSILPRPLDVKSVPVTRSPAAPSPSEPLPSPQV